MQEIPQFAEMPESVRNIMKSSIEQAKKAFDTFISASEKTMSNFDAATPLAGDSVKQLNEKIAEFTKTNADSNFHYAMKLADARQFSDVVELQNAHVRSMMDSFTSQMEELRSLMVSAMQESAQKAASSMPQAPGMPNYKG